MLVRSSSNTLPPTNLQTVPVLSAQQWGWTRSCDGACLMSFFSVWPAFRRLAEQVHFWANRVTVQLCSSDCMPYTHYLSPKLSARRMGFLWLRSSWIRSLSCSSEWFTSVILSFFTTYISISVSVYSSPATLSAQVQHAITPIFIIADSSVVF